jgi:hypothetical protein
MTMPDNLIDDTPAPSADSRAVATPGTSGTKVQIREAKDRAVGEVKNSFRQARDSATSSLNQSRQRAAQGIDGIAGALRSTSEQLRMENPPWVADLTQSLAEQADRVSTYVRDRDLRGFQTDVQEMARRRPAVAITAGLALGLLAARFLKSSRGTVDRSEPPRGGLEEWGGEHGAA